MDGGGRSRQIHEQRETKRQLGNQPSGGTRLAEPEPPSSKEPRVTQRKFVPPLFAAAFACAAACSSHGSNPLEPRSQPDASIPDAGSDGPSLPPFQANTPAVYVAKVK